MTPRAVAGSLALVAALTTTACDGGLVATVPTAPPPSASVAKPELGPLGVFPSKRFGVELPLPNDEPWTIDDTTTPWLTASQAGHSTVLLRVWPSENRMNRDKCEAQARDRRELPVRAETELLDLFELDVPQGFDTVAEVRLAPGSSGELFGFVLAFGGAGRRCFAYVYATSDASPARDRVIADRLAITMERSLRKLRFSRDMDVDLDRAAPVTSSSASRVTHDIAGGLHYIRPR